MLGCHPLKERTPKTEVSPVQQNAWLRKICTFKPVPTHSSMTGPAEARRAWHKELDQLLRRQPQCLI